MRPFIVAEISANHAGSLERALALVDAAAVAGADAIKLQTWMPGTMVLDKAWVLREGPWSGWDLTQLYEQAHTAWEWHRPIFERAHEKFIEPFSTAFDMPSLRFLAELGCKRFKVASFELVDIPLIKAIARTGCEMILSTGMAERAEIDDALYNALQAGARREDVTLLKCTSAYPADPAEANLRTMAHLREWSGCQVGLSDHTPGVAVALIAAAMGATMIEKHLILDDGQDTLDRAFSITPTELAFLCREAPRAAAAPGEVKYGPSAAEKPQLALRRSLYFARTLNQGQIISETDLVTARPARGLPPRMMGKLIGRTVRKQVYRGDPVTVDVLEAETQAIS